MSTAVETKPAESVTPLVEVLAPTLTRFVQKGTKEIESIVAGSDAAIQSSWNALETDSDLKKDNIAFVTIEYDDLTQASAQYIRSFVVDRPFIELTINGVTTVYPADSKLTVEDVKKWILAQTTASVQRDLVAPATGWSRWGIAVGLIGGIAIAAAGVVVVKQVVDERNKKIELRNMADPVILCSEDSQNPFDEALSTQQTAETDSLL